MTVNDLAAGLALTGYRFAHFAWSPAPSGDYGVYAEDGAADFEADNGHAEKATTGTIDYFTRNDSGDPKTAIESQLCALRISWRLNSVQYEGDTGYIHYEWEFAFHG